MAMPEPHCVTPLDLPLIRRLFTQRMPLDFTATLTRSMSGIENAMLSSVPLTDLGAPTVVLRKDECGYVGQFRQQAGKSVAFLTFLAPEPQEGDISNWVRLLEFLAVEAGKRGAHLLNAEVPENHPAFRALRTAGFNVYSRQVILCREAAPLPENAADGTVAHYNDVADKMRPAVDQDSLALNVLYSNTVPRLLQQAEPQPGPETGGLVFQQDDGQLAAYLAVYEGKSGIAIKPYFHPEVYDEAAAIIMSALKHIPRAQQVPVYLYARAYQDWLRGALEEVGFRAWAHQALMVKYTVVRAERFEMSPLPALETHRLRPPVADGPLPLHKHLLLRLRGKKTERRNGHT